MKEKSRPEDDKYNVEATSARDLDGCGTTEATGLIPSLPQSRGQLDSYKSILPFSRALNIFSFNSLFPPSLAKNP